MSQQENIQAASEIRRVFELLDNVNTVKNKGDNFKYGLQVGKLIALGWVLNEVPSSDLALAYDYDDWVRDVKAQTETLRKHLGGLERLLDQNNESED